MCAFCEHLNIRNFPIHALGLVRYDSLCTARAYSLSISPSIEKFILRYFHPSSFSSFVLVLLIFSFYIRLFCIRRLMFIKFAHTDFSFLFFISIFCVSSSNTHIYTASVLTGYGPIGILTVIELHTSTLFRFFFLLSFFTFLWTMEQQVKFSLRYTPTHSCHRCCVCVWVRLTLIHLEARKYTSMEWCDEFS